MEVVSGPHYWWTKPVSMDKPAARSRGLLIWQSDTCTSPSINLIKRNFPQSNVTWPNKSNIVTVTFFGNLYEEKEFHSCTRRSVGPPNRPTDSSSQFCPKISVRHRQRTLTHWVPVMKMYTCDSQSSRPRLQRTFPRETAAVLVSESDSFQFTVGDYVIMLFIVRNVTSSLSRMFSGSGSQSLHMITASKWL